jgi:four helix bundle protein
MAENAQDRSFENLACYQHTSSLFEAGYRLAEHMPAYERFNMADQLRRAALSALSNIAEGYGRYHYLDKLRFFYYARGSLCEILSIFICAHRAGYIDQQQMNWVRETEAEAEKSLNGYIAFIRRHQQGSQEFGDRFVRDVDAEYWTHPEMPNASEKVFESLVASRPFAEGDEGQEETSR